jgi:glycosyltransferase involved in cell wall biosynthesis
LAALLRLLLGRRRSVVLVQNPDDRDVVRNLGVAPDKIVLIPGSGVDTVALTPLPEPDGDVTAAFVGRLLDDKGVGVLVSACTILAEQRRAIRVLIAGSPDPANPASIPQEEIETWRDIPGITLLGHADIRDVWQRAHIAVLPSRREGLPLSLLEASALGRPIVATDVSGCREIARDGVNAILVPPDDPAALAEAIGRMAADPALRASYGAAGRQLVEQNFSSAIVGRAVVALYDGLLAANP